MKNFEFFVQNNDVKKQNIDINLSNSIVRDRMRIKRNGMKYYGESCSIEEAINAIEFAKNILAKIESIQKASVESRRGDSFHRQK